MDAFGFYERKRKTKQLLAALFFLFVLFGGWYFPFLGYFIPLCMLFGIGIGLFGGRKWCDWYCPRGSFYDVFVSRISPKRQVPHFVRGMYLRIAVLLLLILIMGYNLFRRWPHPTKIGIFFVIIVTATTLLGILLALVFHQRTWCFVCPIGTVINAIGRIRRPVEIDSEACVECKLCAKVCPIQIKPYASKVTGRQVVRDRDCLRCGLCIAVCPTRALHFKKE